MHFWSFAPALSLVVVALGSLAACGDKSAVSLTVTTKQPSVTVAQGELGSTLGGAFVLEFNLGPEASGPTTVTLGDFALQTAAGAPLVDQLKVDSGATTFPLTVDKGSVKDVSFAISMSAVLTPAQRDAICAGQVMIVGTVLDSLSGRTDSTQSAAVTPDCS